LGKKLWIIRAAAGQRPRQALGCGGIQLTDIAGCCARAASGHASTEPPRRAMSSRLCMGFIPGRKEMNFKKKHYQGLGQGGGSISGYGTEETCRT
jgi:hypothetical protein